MEKKRQDVEAKLLRLIQFSIQKNLIELAKEDLIALEGLQASFNIDEETFNRERKRILDQCNHCSRSLIDLIDTVFN